MVTRAVAVGATILAVLVLARCSAGRLEGTRALPADRAAAVVYVALGDSTVEGVAATSPERTYVSLLHQRLRAVYPSARAENLGRSGAISADVIADQLGPAVKLNPHLVTMSVGPNDITGGVALDEYERNVARIFRILSRETDAVIVANLLPDLAITPRFRFSGHRALVGTRTRDFNRVLASKAREFDVEVVDLYAASHAEVPSHPGLVASDGYHPSDAGYARWADLMWARIEPRVAVH